MARPELTDEERNRIRLAANGRSTVAGWALDRLVDFIAASFGEEYRDSRNFADCLWRDLAGAVEGFAGPDPTPMEQVLARTAAFDLIALDAFRARFLAAATKFPPTTPGLDHLHRRIDRTHRRLMGTLRTLAAVRKLGLPSTAIQINVGNPAPEFPGPGWTPELDRPSTEE